MARKNSKIEQRKPEILENYYQVIIEDGIEGASIGKIAKQMNIHPSLIIHYFKTKENMTLELVNLLIEKYQAPEFLQFDHIEDIDQRFHALMDTIFSFEWSRTIDPGVHFGFYYLSFRHPEIKKRFKRMIQGFRNYLVRELEQFIKCGIIKTKDAQTAADIIVTLMEGLEFHAHFLSDGQPFENFGRIAKKIALDMLNGEIVQNSLNKN